MEHKVISGDTHVDLAYLPQDVFISNTSENMNHKMPHVVETENGLFWMAGDVNLSRVGIYTNQEINLFTGEMQRRLDSMTAAGFLDHPEKGHHPTTPELRLRDQERDGIDGEVIYGLFDMATRLEDQEQVAEIFRIYNDWIAAFCQTNPERFVGLACLPPFNAQSAATELHRAADLGLKGGEFMVSDKVKPAYHRDWDPLWEAAGETGLSISFHTVGSKPRTTDPSEATEYREVFAHVRSTMFQMSGVELLASVVLSGACERFSRFKFVLGECGASWLPYVLDRMDHEGEGQPGLAHEPSFYWHRQGFSTFQKEAVVGDLLRLAGEDSVIWGSDYPHPDGVWPDSQEVIQHNLRNVKDDKIRDKVYRGNAARLYGFSTS